MIVVASTTGATDRSLGPDWADSLAQARQTCVTGSVVDIRVAPLSYPWEAALSCDRIRGVTLSGCGRASCAPPQ